MSSSTALAFAAPAFTPVPAELRLPAGYVQASDAGRVFVIAGWVVALGVSPSLFIVVQPRPQPAYPSPLLEQLAGFLVGRGAEVLRMDIRFPWQWQQQNTLEAAARFWSGHFLEQGWERRLFVALPPLPKFSILLPVAPAAQNALDFWHETLLLTNALASEFPASMAQIRPLLWQVAQSWERQWNAALEGVESDPPSPREEWNLVYAADRAWARVVREHLEPHHYRMEAASLARLI
jgi:hypothetical protein